MIPNPFGAKIEIFGGGNIKATLEIERAAEAKKEKEEQEEKERENEQFIKETVRDILNKFGPGSQMIARIIDSGSTPYLYTGTITSQHVGVVKLEDVPLYWTPDEQGPGGTITMNFDTGTFVFKKIEELDEKTIETTYPIDIEGNKFYSTATGGSPIHPDDEQQPKDEDITIL